MGLENNYFEATRTTTAAKGIKITVFNNTTMELK
jgi:hypothetical protein